LTLGAATAKKILEYRDTHTDAAKLIKGAKL
jgi:hypothetical protein